MSTCVAVMVTLSPATGFWGDHVTSVILAVAPFAAPQSSQLKSKYLGLLP